MVGHAEGIPQAIEMKGDTTTVCRSTGNESTTGTAYTVAANGALYNEIPAGSYSLMGEIAANSINLPSGSQTRISLVGSSLCGS